MSVFKTSGPSSAQIVAKIGLSETSSQPRLTRMVCGGGRLLALGAVLGLVASGCNLGAKDLVNRANDSTYESQAVDNPCVSSFDEGGADHPLPGCDPPRTIRSEDPSEIDYRNISLDEAIEFAMSHSRLMRDLGGTILTAPDRMQTKYSAAMVTSDPRFGVEGALSEFDMRLTASGNFEKNHRLLNNNFFGGGTNDLRQDLNVYTTQLEKTAATGTHMYLRQFTDY